MPPAFRGVRYVGLSVRNLRGSVDWYREVLGFEVVRENFASSAWPSDWDEVLLRRPDSGLEIGLHHHPANLGEEFSEFRTGLDHIEFEVGSASELDAWRQHLDRLGVVHTGAWPHIVTFRDPDNIQLEFFYPPSRT